MNAPKVDKATFFASHTLTEHLLPLRAKNVEPPNPMPNVQHWRISYNGGELAIVYRGHLTPEQVQALGASLGVSN